MRRVRSLTSLPAKVHRSSKSGLRNGQTRAQMQIEHLPCEPFQMPAKASTKAKGRTASKVTFFEPLGGSDGEEEDVFYQEFSFDDVFLFEYADVPSSFTSVMGGEGEVVVEGEEKEKEGEAEGAGEVEKSAAAVAASAAVEDIELVEMNKEGV
ncbi:hypothetical protein BJX70DRAFT_101960 [Aspergillus crustosus]